MRHTSAPLFPVPKPRGQDTLRGVSGGPLRQRPLERAVILLARAVLVGLWLVRWPMRSRFPYEWDSASHILGAGHFDVYRHHPHPPGYPLYILSLKIARLFTPDLNAAAVALAFVLTGAAAVITYRFARSRYGDGPALVASTLLLFAPSVGLYNAVTSTYPLDLLGSALIGALAARLWDGDERVGPWIAFAIAVFAGFRQSGALMMTPLVIVALARANGTDAVRWGKCAAIGATTTASWYLPTAFMHGGIVPYQQFCNRTVRGYFEQVSVLYGAPQSAHAAMLFNLERWAALTFGIAVLVRATLWLFGRLPSLRPAAPFYILWIAPNVLYVTLLQCIKPGYLLLSVPPVMMLAVAGTASSFEAMAARLRLSVATVASALACVTGVLSTGVACHHFGSLALRRASLASVWEGDAETEAIQSRIDPDEHGAVDTMVIYFSWPWYGPTPQSIMLRYPAAPVAILSSSGGMETHRNGDVVEETVERKPIPGDVHRILWICDSGEHMRLDVLESLPGTRQVYGGRLTTAFLTDIGDAPIDAIVRYRDVPFHFVR